MLLYFPLLFFAGVYVPLQVMPDGIRTISGYTPAGAAAQALSDSWAGNTPHTSDLVMMLVYAAVAGATGRSTVPLAVTGAARRIPERPQPPRRPTGHTRRRTASPQRGRPQLDSTNHAERISSLPIGRASKWPDPRWYRVPPSTQICPSRPRRSRCSTPVAGRDRPRVRGAPGHRWRRRCRTPVRSICRTAPTPSTKAATSDTRFGPGPSRGIEENGSARPTSKIGGASFRATAHSADTPDRRWSARPPGRRERRRTHPSERRPTR